jgi:hypothetical protein
MNLDHWKQLDSLLQSALERPLEERDAFLQHACAGGEPLERRVRALLSAEPGAKHFLERPAIEVAALSLAPDETDNAPERTDSLIGQTVSHYRKLNAACVRLSRRTLVRSTPRRCRASPASN